MTKIRLQQKLSFMSERASTRLDHIARSAQGRRVNRDRKESSSHPRLSLRLSFNFPNLFHIYAKLISFIIMLQPKNLSSRANVDTQYGTHYTAPQT